jgi:hypothetical protein
MSGNNLDITKVASEDQDQLAQKIESFYKQDAQVKSQLSWLWERNHMFLDGKQWIVFDGSRDTGGQWKKLTVSRENEYIPRPTTNYIFDNYQTLKSYLVKNKPRSNVVPNTQLHQDKQAAKISTLCLEANWERLREQNNYEYAASCLVTYGTVFKKSYWDTTALMMARVPRMETVPKTDPMTGQVIGQEERQIRDEITGELAFDEIPLGDVNTCVVEPYRIAIDPLATDLHTARWVMEYAIQPLTWIEEMYDRQEEGYTGRVKEVKEEKSLSGGMRRFFDLKNSSGVKQSGLAEAASTGDFSMENVAVVKEYYERPSHKYPRGRLVVVANNVVLYSGDSTSSGPEQGDWHPYSECRWELVPGRFWGKGPLDDAVEVQKQINSIDSVIILTRKTSAIPQKLIPHGVGINPGQWTGRPNQEVFYRDLGTGAKPEIIPPSGVDAQVFQERAQRVEDLKQIMGAIDILKGDRPPGVEAASAISLLYEIGTGKLFPMLDRWKIFVETDQKKQLKLIANKYKEPRPQFIRMLKMKNQELSEDAISKFIGADLNDNCNVVVEAGSNVPKLAAAKQALLMELAQYGVLNLQMPANRAEFQRQLGVVGFDNDIGPDTKRAEWENDLMDNIVNSPDNKPIVLDCDMHEIHIEMHNRRMKEPAFISLPSEVQQAYTQHVMEHEQFQQMKMQAQAAQQMGMGAMGAPAPGAAGPQQQQPQGPQHGPSGKSGHGTTKELKNALGADALMAGPPQG